MIGMVKADAFQTSIAHVIEREAFRNVLMASVHIVFFDVKCCRTKTFVFGFGDDILTCIFSLELCSVAFFCF